MLHDFLHSDLWCSVLLQTSSLAVYLLCCTAPCLQMIKGGRWTSLYAHVFEKSDLPRPQTVDNAKHSLTPLSVCKLNSFPPHSQNAVFLFSPYFIWTTSSVTWKLWNWGTYLFSHLSWFQFLLNSNNSALPFSKISSLSPSVFSLSQACSYLHILLLDMPMPFLLESFYWGPCPASFLVPHHFFPSLFCPRS